MAAAPGKSCGACTMCCSALEIAHFKKPAGPLCENCRVGGGCAIYAARPQVCRDFECEWLTLRNLPRQLRPTSSAQSSWRTRIATNTAPSARRRSRWLGAIRASSLILSRSPSRAERWSRKPDLRPGGSSARANGDRPSDRPPDISPDCLLARRLGGRPHSYVLAGAVARSSIRRYRPPPAPTSFYGQDRWQIGVATRGD